MRDIKIALLGIGNVIKGVYRIIEHRRDELKDKFEINIIIDRVLVNDIDKKRDIDISRDLLTKDINDIINNNEIDIVVECLGGTDPAREYLLTALNTRKTVVTANKEVIAKHWEELEQAAIINDVGLYFEGSVCGGIPIINAINKSLQGNKILRLMGIINGTTNYILTKMADENRQFEEVLREAQKLGMAEFDPTADVEGFDAMYKLSILSTLCFHKRIKISDIFRQGICSISQKDIECGKELGLGIKLLAIAKNINDKIEVRVHPTFIPLEHPLYAVKNSFNAVFIEGSSVGELMFYGKGAGELPTGSAVVSDIVNACTNGKHYYENINNNTEVIIEDNWKTEYFIRLTTKDQPGVLAEIAGIFSDYGVSLASVMQKGRGEENAPIIFITHKASEGSVMNSIEQIKKSDSVVSIDSLIRVER